MSRVKVIEPVVTQDNYVSSLSTAFNWYNQEKDKKDARAYLKDYVTQHFTKNEVKALDKLPDYKIVTTYAWISRMLLNGSLTLREPDHIKFSNYLQTILDTSNVPLEEEVKEEKPVRPSVRDNMEEKIKEYLGELEYAIDQYILSGTDLNLYNDLKARTIPSAYCSYITAFVKTKAAEFIFAYESTDDQIKEGYSNLGKRKLASLIKITNQWLEDIERYSDFKKVNKKPRARKAKSPIQQVAKLKYKKEDTELNIRSVSPTDIVGASQVWIYNSKYKKLAVYRTDSATGIQVKGTTLQNYDPDMCEQKTLRKPLETIKQVLDGSKVQLRKVLTDLKTKDSKVNGRINEECLIIRAIK